MEKVKIEDTEVFKQVAKVIGEKQAKIELFKASKNWREGDLTNTYSGAYPVDCFIWSESVQGHDFWDNIDEGINPYEK
ncbi:hypothetical protein NVP1063O_086 [Vibrio phage 1.063.O._10N.261.45.C7]|nr:hypothetical protein NVP1063O_086 [Vibrio phage 1.063.O._10N.261.45.C7]